MTLQLLTFTLVDGLSFVPGRKELGGRNGKEGDSYKRMDSGSKSRHENLWAKGGEPPRDKWMKAGR